MAQKVVIDLEVNTDKGIKDVKKLQNSFDSLEDSVDKVSDASDKASQSIDEVAGNGGAIAILDQLTGGLATQFKNVYESTRLFNFSLKGTKKALIATGIGAFIVALGTIVAYWDEIKELIDGTNRKLKVQEQNLTEQLGIQTTQLELLKQQLAIEELKNGVNPELTAEYRKQLLIQREQNIALLENLQTQLDIEKSNNEQVTLFEKLKIGAAGLLSVSLQAEQIAKATNKNSEKSVELTNKINEAKKKTNAIDLEIAQLDNNKIKKRKEQEAKDKADTEKAEKDKADALEKIRQALIDTEEERRQEELRKIKADYDEKIKLAKKYYGEESQQALDLINAKKIAIDNQQQKFDEEDKKKKEEKDLQEKAKIQELNDLKNQIRDAEAVTEEERRQLEIQKTTEHYDKLIALAKEKGLSTEALEKAKTNALNKLTKQRSENEIQWEKLTQQQKTAIVSNGFKNLANILGEESAAGKAAAIAAATIDTYQSANASYKSLAGIPIVGPALGAVAAGAAIVSGLATVKKITSTKIPSNKSVSAPSGGSVPRTSVSQPPAFNVVGASDTNQLADAIGSQSQEPVKAYVVANDVSTAQSMDRNIVEGASI